MNVPATSTASSTRPPGVAAQVDHEGIGPFVEGLLDGSDGLCRRVARELHDPDDRRVRARHPRPGDRGHLEVLAHDRELERFGCSRPVDLDAHRRARLAPDERAEVRLRQSRDLVAVDRDEQVAAPEPGEVGRRPIDDRDDDRLARPTVDEDADAGHSTLERIPLGLELIGREVDRVPVVAERLDQAAERATGQRLPIDRLAVDELLLDDVERLLDEGAVDDGLLVPLLRAACRHERGDST